MAKNTTFVIGVGMTKFVKPGSKSWDYPDMALEAVTKALKDANVDYKQIDQACVGYVYGDTTSGQRAVYQLGMTGIPIYNVNNACSTGSTALMMARQLVEGGSANCVLALGFEKMERTLESKFTDRTQPMDKHIEAFCEITDLTAAPITAQLFGAAGLEHMKKYGTKAEHFGKIAQKNHKHSVNNPYSQFQDEYTLEEIMNAREISPPLTKPQCCPTSDGAAAVIVCNWDFVFRNNLQDTAVQIVAQEMATDTGSTFEEKDAMKLIGYDMTKNAADKAYKKAGISPEDISVIELHDCFSANELVTYEALSLCSPGGAGEFIDNGDNTYGGKYVINPSGGLISKGHPLGATGLAQCAELCWQCRGLAEKRQVPDIKYALQHNLGLGGAVIVTIYRKPSFSRNKEISLNNTSAVVDPAFKSQVIFDEIQKEFEKNGEEHVKKIKGVFRFEIKKGPENKNGIWIVDAKNGSGAVRSGSDEKGDVTITISDEDLVKLMLGKLNPQQAFFQGKLKIKGNMGLAMKLKDLQVKNKAKL